MKNKTLAQHKAQYQLNRHKTMRILKRCLPALERVALNGITSESTRGDLRIARVACCLLVSEIYYDKSIMEDKTGSTNPKDSMDEFLKGLLEEKE